MNIYVGNLPWRTSEEELRNMFEAYGRVDSSSIVKDRETDRSRGFGFVEMPDRNEAQNAIDALNGTDMGGRALVVNEARPRSERPERRGPGGGGGGNRGGGGYGGGGSRGGYGGGGGGRDRDRY